MATADNYYELLGVERTASQKEIRHRYLKLIAKNHPDQFRGLKAKYEAEGEETLLELLEEKIRAAEAFCANVNVAYDTLSDPKLREFYDTKLDENESEAPQIVVTPTAVSFGNLEQDQKRSKSFVIENRGGPAEAIAINWDDEPNWGDLVITPDPDYIFPIEVMILVDASGILPGNKSSTITIDVDGHTHTVSCSVQVESKPVTSSATRASATRPPPGTPTAATTSQFGWLSKFTIVAVIAIVLWVSSTALSNNAVRERELAHRAELLNSDFVTVREIGDGPCSDNSCAWEKTWEVKNETSGTIWYRNSKQAFCHESTSYGYLQGHISPRSSHRFTCTIRPANYRINPRRVLSPCLKFTYKEWAWNDLSIEVCLEPYTSVPALSDYINFQVTVLPIRSDGSGTEDKDFDWVYDLSIHSTFDQEVNFVRMYLRSQGGQVVDMPFDAWSPLNIHRAGTIQPGQTVELRCSGNRYCRPTGLDLCIVFRTAHATDTTLCRTIVNELSPP